MPAPRPPPAKRSAAKRPAADQHDPSISPPPPPPAKRSAAAAAAPREKKTATTTAAAVTSFFTPASQKPKDRTVWEERAPAPGVPTSLLVAHYTPEAPTPTTTTTTTTAAPIKLALFDLDSTLIDTASGKKHATGPGDWKWWHPSVPQRLRALHETEGFRLVIVSNQGGLALHPDPKKKTPAAMATAADRVAGYKRKCSAVLAALDLPVLALYAACGQDRFRKPRAGLWQEAAQDLGADVDVAASFFVGDAAGRQGDFACSDRDFAANAGIAFHTSEEFFLGEAPRPFSRAFDPAAVPRSGQDDRDDGTADTADTVASLFPDDTKQQLFVFCGPPAAGKSSYFHAHLAPRGVHRVNQDTLKTREKCVQAAAALLRKGHSVAIDNTNPDPATRRLWLDLAAEHAVPARCLWFQTDPAVCAHNDAVRALHPDHPVLNPDGRPALPRIAFNGFHARFRPPTADEGFAATVPIAFRFRGSDAEHAIWSRYWV